MNTEQLTTLLARIQVLDNRQVDELTIQAWAPLMEDVNYHDAVAAVNRHFRESTEYLKPAHIIRSIRTAHQGTMSETRDECPPGMHRRLPDGTCILCTNRPALEATP